VPASLQAQGEANEAKILQAYVVKSRAFFLLGSHSFDVPGICRLICSTVTKRSHADASLGIRRRELVQPGRYVLFLSTAILAIAITYGQQPERTWLAGDSHVHSHWSPGYDRKKEPPEPIVGGDGRYSTPMNAQKAREFGLRWMVTTDHGGPNHSKLNLTHAYAELTESRKTGRLIHHETVKPPAFALWLS